MKLFTANVAALAVSMIGCTHPKSDAPTGSGASIRIAPALTSSTDVSVSAADRSSPAPSAVQQGLSPGELQELYHLAEGSEVFPLSWISVLKSKTTGRPFLEQPERFGLLPDHDPLNVSRLPVGMTTHVPADMSVFGMKMVGFNCAACHVGELSYKGQTHRMVGAPNLFDIKGFYVELFGSLDATRKSPWELMKFTRDVILFEPPKLAPGTAAEVVAAAPHAVEIWKAMPTLQQLNATDKAGDLLEDRIREIHKSVMDQPAAAVPVEIAALSAQSVTAAAPDEAPYADVDTPAERTALLGSKLEAAIRRDVKSGNPLAQAPAEKRASAAAEMLSDFRRTARLLRARAQFMGAMLTSSSGIKETPAGPGRVDAFGTARNMIFKESRQSALSPVSYPHLWGFKQVEWLHWDANTNSAMERNMGQAIGLGAIYDDDGESTLIPRNIHRLEQIASKIQPPARPAWLSALDEARAAKGKAIFEAKCGGCHSPGAASKGHDELMDLDAIGTSPIRATSFAAKVKDQDFSAELAGVLHRVKVKAYDQSKISEHERQEFEPGPKPEWRTTRKYPNRPLVAVWATAPYLHNASVPTIADLLLPAEQRPSCFLIGRREYDPHKIGYAYEPVQNCTAPAPAGTFLFNTGVDGNSNQGHSGPRFGTDLTEEQRGELIEFLKTL
ncbi:hypothetical protein [Sorangium sp. So ce1151]|uniref:c-type cytochrome n=1 Tax=Sorangium sp. So ce1151 TaxID=3133332 RepID=UPI003F6153C7